MKYTNLGKTGLKISRICLGAMGFGDPSWRPWVIPESESRPIIQRALELGINFFDTADMYSAGVSEEILGRAIHDLTNRQEVVIATKAYFPTRDDVNGRGLSRKYLFDAIDASLRRLATDYIDVYYIHRWDYSTPIEETLETLDSLVRSGKVRYLGASSMFAFQFAKALYISKANRWHQFVAMQNHYNLVYREEEREMMPLCQEEGIGIVPWSPLARGFLTGSRKRQNVENREPTIREESDGFAKQLYFQEADFKVVDAVLQLSQQRNIPAAEVALAWLLQQKGVSAPIIGTTKISHLESAVKSLDVELTDDECNYLQTPYVPHPVLGQEPYGIDITSRF